MKMNRIGIQLLDGREFIKLQPLCLECDLKTLLNYYGKDYAPPLVECIDFNYDNQMIFSRITDRLQPKHDILSMYNKYGLSIKKILVKGWKEYKSYIHEQIQNGKVMIVHFDCFYLEWDPAYKKNHNNHTLLIAGIQDEQIYLVDPAFNKEGWVEESALEAASSFYYDINGIEDCEIENYHKVMEKKIRKIKDEEYFKKFDLWANDLRILDSTKEFFELDFFDQFLLSELMLKTTRIITNKYRFFIFLQEGSLHGQFSRGQVLSFREIITEWHVFKALLMKAYHQRFSQQIMNRVADHLLKIKQGEKAFLESIFVENISKEKIEFIEHEIYKQRPFNILPYCNNKGIAKMPHTVKADCTGLGEYICIGNREKELKEIGYHILSANQKDNIQCVGQNIILSQDDETKGIKLLVVAEWGNYESVFKLRYEDGTEDVFSSYIKDWFWTGEKRIEIGSSYYGREKIDELFRECVYGDEVVLVAERGKKLKELILPVCMNLHIISAKILY